MKAMLCTRYGAPDVLQLREVDKPVPADNEILIRVHASAVTAGDHRIRALNTPFGFRLLTRLAFGFWKPRRPILGMNLAGVVEAIGKGVSQFKPGDAVFGTSGMALGAYAEHVCLSEHAALALKPANLSFEEAAALPFGATAALCFLRDKGHLQKGEKVLIYGASGAVGSAAIQLAKYFGADVTAVCSTVNLGMVKALGADQVIDYTQDDFTRSGQRYDVIFDTVGHTAYSRSLRALTPNGRYLLTVADLPRYLRILWTTLTSRHKVIAGVASDSKADMLFLKTLVETGKLRPVIDRSYLLEQLAEAHAYAETGHKKGNVVITVT